MNNTLNKTNTPAVLQLHNIHKSYTSAAGAPVVVLNGVSLHIQPAETVAVIGQSGSGKSTLLHIAGLLDTPSSGQVTIQGNNAANLPDKHRSRLRNRHFGFIYQKHHLLPDFTALENVLMPVRINQRVTSQVIDGAKEILKTLGLSHRLGHLPGALSGGEQQRVAIARALITQPHIILADEPTGNLDPDTADNVFAVLQQAVATHGTALLMVTHNHSLAQRCQTVLSMHNGMLTPASTEPSL